MPRQGAGRPRAVESGLTDAADSIGPRQGVEFSAPWKATLADVFVRQCAWPASPQPTRADCPSEQDPGQTVPRENAVPAGRRHSGRGSGAQSAVSGDSPPKNVAHSRAATREPLTSAGRIICYSFRLLIPMRKRPLVLSWVAETPWR